ncbi:hypothetical protein VH569_30500 [Azospirillum sp. 11R-A]|uniref:hypothetical protein n=1 Tax=Azospirillum sp. 11R-A TaxID=3111634 RepID=UPI003C2179E5
MDERRSALLDKAVGLLAAVFRTMDPKDRDSLLELMDQAGNASGPDKERLMKLIHERLKSHNNGNCS